MDSDEDTQMDSNSDQEEVMEDQNYVNNLEEVRLTKKPSKEDRMLAEEQPSTSSSMSSSSTTQTLIRPTSHQGRPEEQKPTDLLYEDVKQEKADKLLENMKEEEFIEPPLSEKNLTTREPKIEMWDNFGRDDDIDQLIKQPITRCAVCGHLELQELLEVTNVDEKALIMLGCMYREEFMYKEAKTFIENNTKTYICRIHFVETLDEIYRRLLVNTSNEVPSCSKDAISTVMITFSFLQPNATGTQLQKIFHDFCVKYEHLRDTLDLAQTHVDDNKESTLDRPRIRPTILYRNPIPILQVAGPAVELDGPAVELDGPVVELEIPKHERHPRKQIYTEDEAIYKITVFNRKPSENEDCENPGVCCFCSKHGDRKRMVRIPRGEDCLARWIEKLGPEFEARLHTHQDNLICRNHFPEAAFSSRGRLLKGMIPDAAPEAFHVTFEIKDIDLFIELNEQKSGTDKNASIDLENIQYDDVQHLASAARHVSYVPQNLSQSNAEKIATPSSSKGSKKRNSNGDSAADDDDFVPHVIKDEVVTDDEIISIAPGPSTSQLPRGRPPKKQTLQAEEGAASIEDEEYVPPRAYGKSQKK